MALNGDLLESSCIMEGNWVWRGRENGLDGRALTFDRFQNCSPKNPRKSLRERVHSRAVF